MIKISTKIKNDKYYTSKELAEYVVDKTKEIIGEENITEYLESSAGNGVFLDYLNKPYLAYDIEPEDDKDRIIKQDYLELDLEYKEGRCVIGNPPYGSRLNLVTQFYKKSIAMGDYMVFILPISQINNDIKLYEFDLIYSENLGVREYSDREVHCCLNMYRRNKNGLNKKPNYKLKDIEIKESTKGSGKRNKQISSKDFNYDIRICSWGNPVGKEVGYEGQYSTEFCIKINRSELKEDVLNALRIVVWEDIYPPTTNAGKINQWQVYKYLKEQIPELE